MFRKAADVGAAMGERRIRPTEFLRYFSKDAQGFSGLFYFPVGENQVLADHKARLFKKRIHRSYGAKVGAVGTSNPVGQAVQAAGTMIAPGNISPFRSPVRSGIARALTPGGGSGRGGLPGKPERGYRCSEGFQFGGRFTDENYSTCGKQLFDIPSFRETLAQAIYRTRTRRQQGSAEKPGSVVEEVTPGQGSEDVALMIRRAARVTQVASMDEGKRSSAIKTAIDDVRNQDQGSALLVRRDGFSMVPVVPVDELRKVPDNRNMEEAAWVQSVRSADSIGGEELGLLSNTGVTTLIYVAPNGVTVRLDRTRELETGERRQLGKDVNTAADMDVSKDPLARLNFIIERSDGAFELKKDFADVEDPEELTPGGKNKDVPKWAVAAFVDAPEVRVEKEADLSESDNDVPDGEAPDVGEVLPEVEGTSSVAPKAPNERIDSLKEAVEHLNKGGLLADIDPSILYEALQRVEGYKKRKLRNDITLFESPDGKKFLLKEDNLDFEHLSAHFSSELLREMGVQAPAVKFAGSETDRPFLYRSPDDVIEGAEIDRDLTSEELPPERILGIQVADWLADTRDRSPASLVGVRLDEEVDVVANVGPRSASIGLDEEELERRRNMVIDEFFASTTAAYGRNFSEVEQPDKDLMIQMLDSLIERASEFSWADYRAKLTADGIISDAEQKHLEIVEGIFNNRLEQLVASKELLQQILGLT
jgi:hypothetical protein